MRNLKLQGYHHLLHSIHLRKLRVGKHLNLLIRLVKQRLVEHSL